MGERGQDGFIGEAGKPGAPGRSGPAGADSDIDYNALNAIVADLLRSEILSLKAPKCRNLNSYDQLCPACDNTHAYSAQAFNNRSHQPSSASYNHHRSDNVKRPTLHF